MMPCRLLFFVSVVFYGFVPMLSRAETDVKSLRPFTAVDGPATVETCTPKALGVHPPPALLAACLYVPFLGKAEVWEVKDKPNRLLSRYATLEFFDMLEKNYKRIRNGGRGLPTFTVFFSDEGYLSLEILGSTFDPATGIAKVNTRNNGKLISYTIIFKIENDLWRVDDIHLFHHGCQLIKSIRAVISNYELWGKLLTICERRREEQSRPQSGLIGMSE